VSDPTEVKRALARLANGESADYPAVSATDDYRTVNDAAADAVDALDDAAAFVDADADGRQHLDTAIEAAETADDHAAARRGRRAREALDALRGALAGRDATVASGNAVDAAENTVAARDDGATDR
jgi:hypothetical protein